MVLVLLGCRRILNILESKEVKEFVVGEDDNVLDACLSILTATFPGERGLASTSDWKGWCPK